MKKELKINPLEIVKPPFFKKGVLRFASSGHYLRQSDRHYRCDLNCRGKCDKNEPQINKENMERNFSRYALNFKFKVDKNIELLSKKLIKDLLHEIIDEENLEEIVEREEEVENTVDTMNAELKHSGNILREDIENFKNQYANINTVNPKLLLTSMAVGVLKVFCEPENQSQIGKEFSILCKRVYITNTGKIKEILLEEWGWYILNFIGKNVPNYVEELKKKGVKILNKYDSPILSLDLKEAVKHFDVENFEDALHSYTIQYFYQGFSMFKSIIDPMVQGKSSVEQKGGLIKTLEQMNNPVFQSLLKVMQIADIKLRKKVEKKKEKEFI
ncbi:MAG: hypothetical protein NTZ87_01000 [Candidatus Nomurabacteria bacterium]|nr:hypothetical protein [Candidatus Nomurabacteria bacterium]